MTGWKPILKRRLLAVAPRLTTALMSARSRAHAQRLVKAWGLDRLNRRLMDEVGSSVVSGPFRGLRLTPMTWQEHIGPFLLGTYEMELHAWWETILGGPLPQVIDVGAQFGYYAVGIAMRCPQAAVVAFDTDRWARRAQREMAAANGVRNLSIHSGCTPEWLNRHVQPGALILSDCEGFEDELFSQVDLGAMARARAIIEVHEEVVPGVTARIESRFAPTHRIVRVASRIDTALPAGVTIRSLDPEELRRVSSEVRSPQTWLLLSPTIA